MTAPVELLRVSGKKGQRGSEVGEYHYARCCVFDDEYSRLYVSDCFNNRVVVLSAEGLEVLGVFGTEGSGPMNFKYPNGVAVDYATRSLLVSDSRNHRVQVFRIEEGPDEKPDGKGSCPSHVYSHTLGDRRGSELGQLNFPVGVTVDKTNRSEEGPSVFVSDNLNHRIAVFSRQGRALYTFGRLGAEPGMLKEPQGMCFSADAKSLLVADHGNNRIQEFAPAGAFLRTFSMLGSPSDIALDAARGYLFATEYIANRVQVFTRDGRPLFHFGSPPESAVQDQFKNPISVAVSARGSICVVDYNHHRVTLWALLRNPSSQNHPRRPLRPVVFRIFYFCLFVFLFTVVHFTDWISI